MKNVAPRLYNRIVVVDNFGRQLKFCTNPVILAIDCICTYVVCLSQ